MTELVDDYVPSEVKWQELELVMKIEISFRGTAPPTTLRIFDGHSIIGHPNPLCFKHNHRHQKSPRRLFVIEVRGSFRTWCWCRPALFDDATFYRTPQLLHIIYGRVHGLSE